MPIAIPNKFQERYDSLTAREKVIVITALLAALWGLWDSAFYQPVALKRKTLEQQLLGLNTQITGQQRILTELEQSANIDPNVDNQKKLAELKAQYSRLQEQVILGSKKFVPPQLMAKALSDLLKQNQQLKLIKLQTLPPKSLETQKQAHHPIYKHGLEMTFVGSYADTVAYLEALEAVPWAIVWESLDYQVKNYPLAEITIRVVTLSFEKGWLGV